MGSEVEAGEAKARSGQHPMPITSRRWSQGRVIDHVRNTQSVGLEDLQALILDEADRLLEMGFADEVRPKPVLHEQLLRVILHC